MSGDCRFAANRTAVIIFGISHIIHEPDINCNKNFLRSFGGDLRLFCRYGDFIPNHCGHVPNMARTMTALMIIAITSAASAAGRV